MKKFLILLILISYSFSSIGVTVNYFYCCGKLKTVSLKQNNSDKKKCKKKKGKKCCENKLVDIKIKGEQKQSPKFDFKLPTIVAENACYNNYSTVSIANFSVQNFSLYSNPPPQNFLSKSILYCVFRI